ncbi:MAG: DEAD/DEAH box helicase family protein [Dokdonella sp.]|uniref:DEAD/DEAH box helicase family protein n=1 Tax=Dokdonella sp. TaxID=2291710 RepID=UPI0025C3CEC5|nr:DEAD/DEAH box helicase family protein [Dokdonella sp.]MBK8123955.1 DEAD/DEAH box helicase family protein [Dokdonella sp.]
MRRETAGFRIWDYNVVLSGHPHSRNPNAPMRIASIQTLIRREYPPADLIIVDESHHVCGGQYQTLLKNYPDAYVLGLTATPERLDGKGWTGFFTICWKSPRCLT